MKTEKYILTALCAIGCLWAIKMVVGVVGLALHQDVSALAAFFEIGAFVGAALIPLAFLWLSRARMRSWLLGPWVLSVAYVCLLSLNGLRLGLPISGVTLAFWVAIVILFARALRRASRQNLPNHG